METPAYGDDASLDSSRVETVPTPRVTFDDSRDVAEEVTLDEVSSRVGRGRTRGFSQLTQDSAGSGNPTPHVARRLADEEGADPEGPFAWVERDPDSLAADRPDQ